MEKIKSLIRQPLVLGGAGLLIGHDYSVWLCWVGGYGLWNGSTEPR